MKPATISKVLTTQLLSTATYRKVCQLSCFVSALLILVLSFWKLTQFELTETQLFFGVLGSLVLPLLGVVLALALPMTGREKSLNR